MGGPRLGGKSDITVSCSPVSGRPAQLAAPGDRIPGPAAPDGAAMRGERPTPTPQTCGSGSPSPGRPVSPFRPWIGMNAEPRLRFSQPASFAPEGRQRTRSSFMGRCRCTLPPGTGHPGPGRFRVQPRPYPTRSTGSTSSSATCSIGHLLHRPPAPPTTCPPGPRPLDGKSAGDVDPPRHRAALGVFRVESGYKPQAGIEQT